MSFAKNDEQVNGQISKLFIWQTEFSESHDQQDSVFVFTLIKIVSLLIQFYCCFIDL